MYNDDVKTFDYINETVIYLNERCAIQAEQCAILVHYKGKYTLKIGTFDELKPQGSLLIEAELSTELI